MAIDDPNTDFFFDSEFCPVPTSGKEAKKVGAKFFFPRTLCRNSHLSLRRSDNRCCVLCEREKTERRRRFDKENYKQIARKYYKNNTDKIKALKAKWYENNREYALEYAKQYREDHKLQCLENERRYRESNRENIIEYRKKYEALRSKTKLRQEYMVVYRGEHYKKNKHKYLAWSRKRKAIKRNACPAWADHQAIIAIYDEARRITEQTGIAHHVDHIVPIQGMQVCGLHVAENLRIIPAIENLAKNNNFDEDYLIEDALR